MTRGEVEVDEGHERGHRVTRVWLEPCARIHPVVKEAIGGFDAAVIGPGSFFTSLMPTLLVEGVAEALASVKGPIILVSNLLTEGRGMGGFTAQDAVEWVGHMIGRPVDVVIANSELPPEAVLAATATSTRSRWPSGSSRRRASW
ncbi:MAG: 2-phospho-L-lactate transferase CofD family protein [Vicinamibacterales bacterium]